MVLTKDQREAAVKLVEARMLQIGQPVVLTGERELRKLVDGIVSDLRTIWRIDVATEPADTAGHAKG